MTPMISSMAFLWASAIGIANAKNLAETCGIVALIGIKATCLLKCVNIRVDHVQRTEPVIIINYVIVLTLNLDKN